jgi:hypothetical protein
MPEAIKQGVPELLRELVNDVCRMPEDQFRVVPADMLPSTARKLLDHSRDMTSTLGEHHGKALQVEVLQEGRVEDLYCREVFLRTVDDNSIVEYGVIAIRMEEFAPEQQDAIRAGKVPLGALLHDFKIPFGSAPICFFTVTAEGVSKTPFGGVGLTGASSYGRFNQLTKTSGEPLAWIMEILPTE